MKRLFVLIICLAALSAPARSFEPLVAYQSEGLWHITDMTGQDLLTPFQAEEVGGWSEGYLSVQTKVQGKLKWGYMDSTGKFAIEPKYDKAGDFHLGFAVVLNYTDESMSEMKFGMINRDGSWYVPAEYDEILDYSDGLAYVYGKKFKGYVDLNGDVGLALNNLAGYKFSQGRAAVSNPQYKIGYIDKKGKIVIPTMFTDASEFSEGLAFVSDGQKYGYIDTNGFMLIPNSFDKAGKFIGERAKVARVYSQSMTTLWGIIDRTGKNLTGFKYAQLNDFAEGLASFEKDRKWGFIDINGAVVIKDNFSHCGTFVNGIAWASQKDIERFGFINHEGDFVMQVPKADKYVDLRINQRVY